MRLVTENWWALLHNLHFYNHTWEACLGKVNFAVYIIGSLHFNLSHTSYLTHTLLFFKYCWGKPMQTQLCTECMHMRQLQPSVRKPEKKSQGRSLTVHHNNIPTLFSPSNHTMTWLPAILVHFMKRKRTTVCFHRRCYACLITIFELILSPLFSLMWHCCLEFHSFADVSTKCVHATPCTRPCDESIL